MMPEVASGVALPEITFTNIGVVAHPDLDFEGFDAEATAEISIPRAALHEDGKTLLRLDKAIGFPKLGGGVATARRTAVFSELIDGLEAYGVKNSGYQPIPFSRSVSIGTARAVDAAYMTQLVTPVNYEERRDDGLNAFEAHVSTYQAFSRFVIDTAKNSGPLIVPADLVSAFDTQFMWGELDGELDMYLVDMDSIYYQADGRKEGRQLLDVMRYRLISQAANYPVDVSVEGRHAELNDELLEIWRKPLGSTLRRMLRYVVKDG